MDRESANAARVDSSSRRGHYESWFLRANHPTEPRAFWIRYTIFSSENGLISEGELWAIYFDGDRCVAAREAHPLAQCTFDSSRLGVFVAGSELQAHQAHGRIEQGTSISWDLGLEANDGPPLLLLPEMLYSTLLPKAKALVPMPDVRFTGKLVVDGELTEIDGWRGSQNHNWGCEHTDRYAWGQVAGFDDAANAFLEVSTARIQGGPLAHPGANPVGAPNRRSRVSLHSYRPSDSKRRPILDRSADLEIPCEMPNQHGSRAQAGGDSGHHARRPGAVRRVAVSQSSRRHENVPQLQGRGVPSRAG